MDEDIKRSVSAGDTWIRGAFMLLFVVVYSVVEAVLLVIAFVQWLFLLFSGEPSERLLDFSDDLTVFMYQIWQYLTMNSEQRPWPFSPWPYVDEREAVPEPAVETASEASQTEGGSVASPHSDEATGQFGAEPIDDDRQSDDEGPTPKA